MTEREKMEKGLWYDANNDKEILKLREDAEELCYLLNQTSPKMQEKREAVMEQLFRTEEKRRRYCHRSIRIIDITVLLGTIRLSIIMPI